MSVTDRTVAVEVPVIDLIEGLTGELGKDQLVEVVKKIDEQARDWDFTREVALWALEELRSLAVDELNEEEAGMATAAFSAASAVIARLEG